MVIAVDVGGTKTLVARFSSRGAIEKTTKFPTPPFQGDFLKALVDVIYEVADDQKIDTISLGLPGTIRDGVLIWCGNLPWENFSIQSELSTRFPDLQILMENDANLGGLAETRSVTPVPVSSLYVTISTGIGTGIITNGNVDPGMRFSEGGHMLIEFDGLVQLWERFASGKAIYETYETYARNITSEKIWFDIADRISRGFLVMIPLLQPEMIIIGGSIGTFFGRYNIQLEKLLRERLPDHIDCPKIVAAKHPEEAVIYGCYLYATDHPRP